MHNIVSILKRIQFLRHPLESVVCTTDAFGDNLSKKKDFTQHLRNGVGNVLINIYFLNIT